MTHLPDDLWQLPDLRELSVSYCRDLEHIPDNIPADARLESLQLSGDKITRLPSSLYALSNLTHLSIYHCRTEALPDDFWRLTSLRTFVLESTRITRLSPSMDRLTNLVDVQLKDRHLNIGGAFSRLMPSMRRLLVHRVPNAQNIDRSGLTGLTELTIEASVNNGRSQVNPSIGSLSGLKTLTFVDCVGLTALPAAIGRLSNLQRLAFHEGCSLTTLPATISTLTNRTGLYMDEMEHDFTLPQAISGLVSLRELRVVCESALHMAPTIQLPQALTELFLHAKSVQLPTSFTSLTRLRDLTLNLRGPAPDSLPALGNMPGLHRLTVQLDDLVSEQRVGEMLAHAGLTYLELTRGPLNSLAPVLETLPTLTSLRELHIGMDLSDQDEPDEAEPGASHWPALNIPSSMATLSRLVHFFLKLPGAEIPPGVFLLTSLQMLRLFNSTDYYARCLRLSHAVTNLVSLRDLQLPESTWLCKDITRLSKLTRINAQWVGDAVHQRAVKTLLARGVQYDSQPVI
jgi:Leucine-rich repeat (LRR) protein